MRLIICVALGCLLSVVSAQYQFILPNPNITDLTEHWKVGETIKIQWQGGWHGVGDDPGKTDLWISWFRSNAFSQLLLPNVDLSKDGSFDWKVNVSNHIVETDVQFVFRFCPHTDPPVFTGTENESPSRGFNLLPGPETSSSASSASSTSASATSTTPNNKKKTNVGAIAGGVLGGLVFLIMLLVIALLLLKLARKRKVEKNNAAGEAAYGMLAVGNRTPPSEMTGGPPIKYGAMGQAPTELYGGGVGGGVNQHPYELDGGQGQPMRK
ncbi:hypothetical protein BCR34DRAFT_587591 [Clohesyomyces aquaticus]|uniref:Mid2 domain-containing protein n=1 Tax=Clohesyomyces aquaticus TaxID=1231657 RepID=A0A1Y1ZNV9_9PLEO|nr:hypothetical protein BCR34DRAFT_587591 [Clohesyomyces aquaticus]